jgi:hypothetical protein
LAEPHRRPSALQIWWWRTPTWSRLLAGVGGTLITLMIVAVAMVSP